MFHLRRTRHPKATAIQAGSVRTTAQLLHADTALRLAKDDPLERAARAVGGGIFGKRKPSRMRVRKYVVQPDHHFGNESGRLLFSKSHMDGDTLLAYWATGKNAVKYMPIKHLSLVQDCLDLGTEKIELTAIWMTFVEEGFWAAPLVKV